MWKIPEFTPCFEGNTLKSDAKVVSRSVLKGLTGQDSGEKNASGWVVAWILHGHALFIPRCLPQFMGKYRAVHNLESRSLRRRWDQSECPSSFAPGYQWALFREPPSVFIRPRPVFLRPSSVSIAKSKCFCILQGHPIPFTPHLFPLMEFWFFDLSLLLFPFLSSESLGIWFPPSPFSLLSFQSGF